MSPLFHEFSYQAMLHDTLEKDIKAGLGQTSFSIQQSVAEAHRHVSEQP